MANRIHLYLYDPENRQHKKVIDLLEKTDLELSFSVFNNPSELLIVLNEQAFPDILLVCKDLLEKQDFEFLNIFTTKYPLLPFIIYSPSTKKTDFSLDAEDYLTNENMTPVCLKQSILFSIAQKKLKNSCKEHEKMFQSLFHNTHDIIIFLDTNHNIEMINSAGLNKLGYTLSELKNSSLLKLFSQTSLNLFKNINILISEKSKKPYELELITKDAKTLICEANFTILKDSLHNKNYIVAIFKDITIKKEAESSQQETLDLKSQFISMVSHELRTPITAISGSLEMLIDGDLGEIPHEQFELLEMAKKNVGRLTNLINEVVNFHKLSSGKRILNPSKNNINEIISDTIKVITPSIKEKNISFILKLSDSIPVLKFDREKITQLILNLLSNVITNQEQGKVIISSKYKKNEVIVAVKDNGPGIKPEDQVRIFQIFQKIKTSRFAASQKGAGLGLAICKEIIKHHSGKIWLKSEVGKGSTFYFSLPVKQTKNTYRIMVVDDDQTIIDLLKIGLKQFGIKNKRVFELFSATDGYEACLKAGAIQPDLIISDIKMPKVNGIEMFDKIKESPEIGNIQFIFFSGLIENKVIEQLENRNIKHYLHKPVDIKELTSTIIEVLDS